MKESIPERENYQSWCLREGAYWKREPIREGYFLRGELIREGSKKERERWRGRIMTDLLRTRVRCIFFLLVNSFRD